MTERKTRPKGQAIRLGRLFAGVTIALAVAGVRTEAAAEIGAVACNTLSIAVEGTDAVQVCEGGSYVIPGADGGPIQVGVEAVAAVEESSWLVITSYKITGHAAFSRRSTESFVDDQDWFAITRSWGEEYDVGQFDAVPFEARLASGGGFRHCVGFVRYIGHVSHSVGGVRQVFGGAYCKKQTGSLSPEEVRGVLGRLRF